MRVDLHKSCLLISVALIALLALPVSSSSPFVTSRNEILDNLLADGKQLSTNEVRQILKEASPSMRIGRVSARDLTQMDQITIEHCNAKELGYRRDNCKKSSAGENVRLYCEDRFAALIDFCATKVAQIMRANIINIGEVRQDLQFFKSQVAQVIAAQESENVKEAIEHFLKENKHASEGYKRAVKPKCEIVTDNLSSVGAVVGYKMDDSLLEHLNRSLADTYKLYLLCKVYNENFANEQ